MRGSTAWALTVLGTLVAAFLFTVLFPSLADTIVVVSLVLLGVGALLFGLDALSAALHQRHPVRYGIPVVALLVVLSALSYIFYLLGFIQVSIFIGVLAVIVFLILGGLALYFGFSTQPAASSRDLFDVMASELDTNRYGLFRSISIYWNAVLRNDLSQLQAATANNLLSVDATRHEMNRRPAETDAVIAAHQGAAEARVHPNVFHLPEYQIAKLNLTVTQELKLFEVHLDHLKDKMAYELDLEAAKDLDARLSHRVIGLQRRFMSVRDDLDDLRSAAVSEDIKKDKIRVTRKTLSTLEADLDALLRESKQNR